MCDSGERTEATDTRRRDRDREAAHWRRRSRSGVRDNCGPVDYALFVCRTLCGVVEAKPEGTTLSGFSDQAARYMGGLPAQLVLRQGQVRFEFVASGTEILFCDHADPAPRSRRVFFFHRPETLRRWLGASMTIRGHLQSMPPLLPERLRDCQIDAVTKLEASSGSRTTRSTIRTFLPPPDEIAAEIVENLEAALDRFRKVALSLQSQ